LLLLIFDFRNYLSQTGKIGHKFVMSGNCKL
jgi:hypothetical protein